jgi:hypothetical protein
MIPERARAPRAASHLRVVDDERSRTSLRATARDARRIELALSSLCLTLRPVRDGSSQFVCFAPSVDSPRADLDEHALFAAAHDVGHDELLYERIVTLTRKSFRGEIADFVSAGRAGLRPPLDAALEALWARVASAIMPRAPGRA